MSLNKTSAIVGPRSVCINAVRFGCWSDCMAYPNMKCLVHIVKDCPQDLAKSKDGMRFMYSNIYPMFLVLTN